MRRLDDRLFNPNGVAILQPEVKPLETRLSIHPAPKGRNKCAAISPFQGWELRGHFPPRGFSPGCYIATPLGLKSQSLNHICQRTFVYLHNTQHLTSFSPSYFSSVRETTATPTQIIKVPNHRTGEICSPSNCHDSNAFMT